MIDKPTPPHSGTVLPDEIARFTAIADSWWDPEGEFKPLHHLNPARLAFVRERVAAHFGRAPGDAEPFKGTSRCWTSDAAADCSANRYAASAHG